MKKKTHQRKYISFFLSTLLLIPLFYWSSWSWRSNFWSRMKALSSAKVEYCKSNSCIQCSCQSASDCQLVTNMTIISECVAPDVVSKSTSQSCLNQKLSSRRINASCSGGSFPSYQVTCVNNTCGKVLNK